MNDPKPLASLSSTLLARKGGAKPAMRRQGIHISDQEEHPGEGHHEDLGWNDMGYDTDPDHHATNDAIDNATNNEGVHHNLLADAIPESIPAVKNSKRKLQRSLAARKKLSRLKKWLMTIVHHRQRRFQFLASLHRLRRIRLL
jgi:hypothetical protein